ncbi:MAG: hypothetical protein U0L11_11430 [Acutalibacteraceae bacterium]|nr:hypothetical protein [Acutalibacteraceae bacterium]
MARSPEAQHDCPLLNRRVYWGDCYEVQEIREDSMDAYFFPDKFEVDEADIICEKCKWYQVGVDE